MENFPERAARLSCPKVTGDGVAAAACVGNRWLRVIVIIAGAVTGGGALSSVRSVLNDRVSNRPANRA